MIRIEIEPVWRFTRDNGAPSMLVMLDFLNDIRASGKITRAAERSEVSYRHAWNLIEKWSGFFETPLVERRQGRGTTLTPFGERLVWAGQRLQARLGPQLQNLAQELQTELNELLPGRRPRHCASMPATASRCRSLQASCRPPAVQSACGTSATSATRPHWCHSRTGPAIWRACICHRGACASRASRPAGNCCRRAVIASSAS